tara:strand:- start:8989 stop:9177 length:189 start_codon:yes stop_codon:yes gene_type:complete
MDKILRKTAWFLAAHIDEHLRKTSRKRLAARLMHEVEIEEIIFEGLNKLGLGDKKYDDVQQG